MGAPIYQMDTMNQVKKDKKPDSNSLEEQNKKTEKEKIAKAAEKKRLNTKTTETKAKTVRQGKLDRESDFDKTKDGIRETRKKEKQAIKDKKKSLNINEIEGSGQSTGFDDSSERKKSRSKKRAAMRDARNAERGARRTDRANRSIKRIGDRNDMTVGEATKTYNARQEALGGYKKGERGPDPANVDKQKKVDKQNTDTTLQTIQETNVAQNLTGNSDKTALKNKIMDGNNFSPNQMLDGPTQQEASEDSQGISSYMNNSENRRGR